MTMTPEQINIACAEECGWYDIDSLPDGYLLGTQPIGGNHFVVDRPVPNYHSDANAALELCEVMYKNGYVIDAIKVNNGWCASVSHHRSIGFEVRAHSLSAAICECFLRVKGKWN